MFNKIYVKHIYSIFLIRFINITLIFSSLIFVMNILEELKFFSDIEDIGIEVPITLTILNLPSILFEVFPFIILITTQFFYIKFQNNSEILIFKNNGVNNLKIISYICFLVFFIGLILITVFHFISSNMKNNYLQFKNKYTDDNKYLAVINENGLWIKDKLDNKLMIIHAEKVEKNILKDLVITLYDQDFVNENNIIAKEANIINKNWEIKEVIKINNFGEREMYKNFYIKTNFDYMRINSLYSNLESLNIIDLIKQRNDFKNVGLSVMDIEVQINKILSLPISLAIFSLLSSVIMFNIKLKHSKTFMLILGILLSVIIYYVYYFFGLLGSNNQIPVSFAIWLPNLILLLSCIAGATNINEK